jgi:hypothetical protein
MNVHALTLRMPVAEIASNYARRVQGTQSKLSTFPDGLRIAWRILQLLRQRRPFAFFSAAGGLLAGTALALFYPVLMTFLETGVVPRFPMLIVSLGLAIMALIMVACGLILDTMMRAQLEIRRLLYLNAGRTGTIAKAWLGSP